MGECIFCRIVKKEIKSEVIAESNSFIAISDVHPITKGHALIIPKKHMVTLLDVPDSLGQELLKFTKQVAFHLLDEKYGDGFNLVMNNLPAAGQEVEHAHWHIIPRKEGDKIRFFVK